MYYFLVFLNKPSGLFFWQMLHRSTDDDPAPVNSIPAWFGHKGGSPFPGNSRLPL